jgi:hypothetical protein
MADMGQFIEQMAKAGVPIATEGCLPSAKGARVRLSNGKLTVTDGPFTESKELIGGFALIQANSKEEAIEWTKRFLEVAGDGESEIRQIAEAEDFGPESTNKPGKEQEQVGATRQSRRPRNPSRRSSRAAPSLRSGQAPTAWRSRRSAVAAAGLLRAQAPSQ